MFWWFKSVPAAFHARIWVIMGKDERGQMHPWLLAVLTWFHVCFYSSYVAYCALSSSFNMYCSSAGLEPNLDGFVYRTSSELIHLSELDSRTLCVLTAGLQVCLFVFIPPSIQESGCLFIRLPVFADFRSDMTHNRPSVSEAFLCFAGFRYRESSSCFSPTDGITYPGWLS